MAKQLKTAPELERLILIEVRRHAICSGVAAVTVREVAGGLARRADQRHDSRGDAGRISVGLTRSGFNVMP